MTVPRCRDMIDKYDREAEQNLSSHADGTGLIPAMVRLGVIRPCPNPATLAAPKSGHGLSTSDLNRSVDDGTAAPRDIVMLGAERPQPR
jgi:hypothetical protein